jgi:DNA-binding CsgD family transcriptional regulator/tetratricopeptide (TPR) repeat protein
MELLERDEELATLAALASGAVAGHGALVLVTGEAGIGKSALVEVFAHSHAAELRVLWGWCDQLATPRPLGPVRDLARQVRGPLAEHLASGDDAGAVDALLDEMSRPPGSVLVVEDAHWADEATLDLLTVLARRIGRLPGLLVVTLRDAELADDHPLRYLPAAAPATVLALRPLSPYAVAALAGRVGRPAAGVHAITGGNPFFVGELLRDEAAGVPRTVADAVLARVHRCSPTAREVLDLVAVVPGRAEPWLLEAQPPEECLRTGLLRVEGGTVGYRHELARLAVESSLPARRRRELHARVLTALLARDDADLARCAHHAAAAGDAGVLRQVAPAAAREAAAAGAHREAARQAMLALSAGGPLPLADRAELLELASVEAYLAGMVDDAVAAREEAVRLREQLGDRDALGAGLRWLARLLWWSSDAEAAHRAAERAIEVLEPAGPSHELAMAYSGLSQLHMLADENEDAITLGEKAIALARRLGDAEALAHALTNVGTAAGRFCDAGREQLAEAATIAAAAGLADHAARALVNRAYTSLVQRRFPLADTDMAEASGYAEAHELHGYAQYLLGMRSWWHLEQGNWSAAERVAREALAQRLQPGISHCPGLVVLGTLQSRYGCSEAAATLDEAAKIATRTGELQRIGPTMAARAEHAWLAGDLDRCAVEAGKAFAQARDYGEPWLTGELGAWLHRAGRPVELPSWVAMPYRLLASGDWAAAAKAWNELGCPYQQALALIDGDADGGLRALPVLDRLGATVTAALVRRGLRGRGVRHVPRGPRPAARRNPAGLTVRQQEVLDLLADGLSNAEIADKLVIAPKTAELHVSAVLGKLRVSSRREAVAAAQRLGLVAGSRT